MQILDRKVLRDLWKMRINAIAIVLVLGCGVAILVMAVGMRGSLERTRLNYYAAYKMADLAVSLVRAPTSTASGGAVKTSPFLASATQACICQRIGRTTHKAWPESKLWYPAQLKAE